MDNRSSSTRRDPVTQASEFFIEFRAGDGTAALRSRFERWLRSSPEHVKAYLEIAAGWAELPTGDPEHRIDLHDLLATVHGDQDGNVINIDLRRVNAAYTYPRDRVRIWLLAGSLALLLVVFAATGMWIVTQSGFTYKTGIGEQRTLILPDGSTVILDALTTVRARMTKEDREVTLVRGQAYFHDTKDPTRPFVVRVGKSFVRAIGTEFDVAKEPDRIVVTVLAGQVAVAKSVAWVDSPERRELLHEPTQPAHNQKAVLVSAGEQVTVLAQSIPAPRPVDVTAVTAVMAWRERRLVFDGTPLEEVARKFNLYSWRRIVIADPSLLNLGVSGEYSVSDPDALIGFMRSQPRIDVVEKSDEFLVTGRQR